MKICAMYLGLLAFSLRPCLVKADDWGLTLFEPQFSFFDSPETTLSSLIRRHQDGMFHSFFRGAEAMHPHYEMANDPEQFQVVLNLPNGLSPEDVHVDFNERNRMLTISSQSAVSNEEKGYYSSSQFSRSFTLDPCVEAEKLTATFDQGVLTVTAPKDVTKVHTTVRSIPVLPAGLLPSPPTEVEELPEPPTVDEEAPEPPMTEEEPRKPRVNLDPFHIKERMEMNRRRRKEEEEAFRRNPNERLESHSLADKKTELRRR